VTDRELVRHMHEMCGHYHMHFSTVRTAATALIVPIGLGISVDLLDAGRAAVLGRFPYVLFMLVALLVVTLNVVFSAFSKRCRLIERYLETQLADGIAFDQGRHGFRHLFWCADGTVPGLDPRPRWTEPGTWWDVFMWPTLAGAVLYLAAFMSVYAQLRP
jgi:hypothetical protein